MLVLVTLLITLLLTLQVGIDNNTNYYSYAKTTAMLKPCSSPCHRQ